jgi:ubiquinone/menaquinone biosynthesis C-methylase UbiE
MNLPGQAQRGLLRFGFRLLYNELAWCYDTVSWAVSLGHWRAWTRTSELYLRGARVLEIAFGTGDLLCDLRAAGVNVCGLDLSPQMVTVACRKLRKAGLSAPITRGSVTHLPFADGSFDSVVSTFPTPFIRQDDVLNELARVLRPGGCVVIVDRAQVLKPAWPARLIDVLYVATGQQPEVRSPQAKWMRARGWNAQDRAAHLETSIVHLVVAEPPPLAVKAL